MSLFILITLITSFVSTKTSYYRGKGKESLDLDAVNFLITTDDVISACTNFTNVVVRIMRDDESKGGCNSSKI
jgi:hypothetical protein